MLQRVTNRSFEIMSWYVEVKQHTTKGWCIQRLFVQMSKCLNGGNFDDNRSTFLCATTCKRKIIWHQDLMHCILKQTNGEVVHNEGLIHAKYICLEKKLRPKVIKKKMYWRFIVDIVHMAFCSIWLSNLFIISEYEEGYNRNGKCLLNWYSHFYYHYWVDASAGGLINRLGNHPSGS